MGHTGGSFIQAALFAGVAVSMSQARAEDVCTRMVFKAGSRSTAIRGVAPAGGSPVCYALLAKKGQLARLSVADSMGRVVFKINDPVFNQADDALHVATFRTKQKIYQIIVFDGESGAEAVPFTLSVSLK